MSRYLILDVASAPLADAASYVEAASAPANYKDEAKIAAYVAEKTAERVAGAALDLDLARITAIGMSDTKYPDADVRLCQTEASERSALVDLADALRDIDRIITYGGFHFDLPLLMRRARYLGVDFPKLNTDRYKSPHVDLLLELSDRDPSRRRPLSFYCRRLGWTDLVKPLDGAEEAQVFATGNWEALRASVAHDVEAVRRLAVWLGILPAVAHA